MAPKLICLSPVRNEAWILNRYLKCASLWADNIIIADQNSTDGSDDIARGYQKVTLVDNPSNSYDEPKMRKLLFDEARRIPGSRLLFFLDADEILTSNFLTSLEWKTMLGVKPGTTVWFKIVNIRPDMHTFWRPPYDTPLAFMDDGREFPESAWRTIHGPRIPKIPDAPSLILREVLGMHYQYTDWERMRSKHRWYQCWERINDPKRSAIDIFRTYHHMYGWKPDSIEAIPQAWFEGYQAQGIDMTSTSRDASYYWDKEVLEYFNKYGTSYFAKERVWDIDWKVTAKNLGYENIEKYRDPRSRFEQLIQRWLFRTQPRSRSLSIRLLDYLLKSFGR